MDNSSTSPTSTFSAGLNPREEYLPKFESSGLAYQRQNCAGSVKSPRSCDGKRKRWCSGMDPLREADEIMQEDIMYGLRSQGLLLEKQHQGEKSAHTCQTYSPFDICDEKKPTNMSENSENSSSEVSFQEFMQRVLAQQDRFIPRFSNGLGHGNTKSTTSGASVPSVKDVNLPEALVDYVLTSTLPDHSFTSEGPIDFKKIEDEFRQSKSSTAS